LHLSPTVGNAIDDDVLFDDAIDHPPRLVVQFPVLGDTQANISFGTSACGQIFEPRTGFFDFAENALGPLCAIPAGE